MSKCPQCGNSYPDNFYYCPVDGSAIENSKGKLHRAPAQIRVKTLFLGIAVLVALFILAFAGTFFYQYWKPKYGSLTIKTTPPGAFITIDGKLRGAAPITISDLLSGAHLIKGTREGYKEFIQQVNVMPYATENLHWNMDPLVPQLSNEQLAEVEDLRKKLDNAQKEDILLPPPSDYNALYFADKILAIDPANSYAADVKARIGDSVSRLAELAYVREDWLESEKQYKNLTLLYPNDISIGERLAEVSSKIESSMKDREKQLREWKSKTEAAMKAGSLTPPDKENALDAARTIQRLDKNNLFARETISRIKEMLQHRGDSKITVADWNGARNDFRLILQYFPEDTYSKSRLTYAENKVAETAQVEQQRMQRANEEQQSRQKIAALRQSALNSYKSGAHQKSIAEWQEYLKFEPNSDEAYFYLGASYQEQKQFDTAILDFEKCISLNPGNALGHLNLGLLYDYHRSNYKQAEEHLRKAKELGGAERYSPERIQSIIQDIQDRAQAGLVLKTSFPVLHKHTFSNCKGAIQFSEEGIEFKTTETDHSFYEAYSKLRSFDINNNELLIRTRNNKKYSFLLKDAADAARIRAWNSMTNKIHPSGKED